MEFGAPCCVSSTGVESKKFLPIVESAHHGICGKKMFLIETDSQVALDDAEKYLVTCGGVKWFALVASALALT